MLDTVRECTGDSYGEVYIVGGGSKNAMINQRCATGSRCRWWPAIWNARPLETQCHRSYFHPEYSYDRLEIVVSSLKVKRYEPAK
ncbi:MAG: hypothetical protein ACLVJO_02820 [[Clostridium] scindens]